MPDAQAQPLLSTPITEVIIGPMEARYVTRVWRHLESLGCNVRYLREQDSYHIQFPEGTIEQTYAGQSTQWTHKTTIRLPGGQTLTKCVAVSLSQTDKSTTTLGVPAAVLEGPAPPTS